MGIQEKIASEESMQIVIFRLGEDYLSCPISQVREIIQLEKVTPVPSTPEEIRGIINRRGEIITIVDLPKVIDVGLKLKETESQLLILYSEDENVGVMTSEVTEIPTVDTNSIEPPSDTMETPINREYLEGIIKREERLVLFVDLLALVENLSQQDLDRAAEFGEGE